MGSEQQMVNNENNTINGPDTDSVGEDSIVSVRTIFSLFYSIRAGLGISGRKKPSFGGISLFQSSLMGKEFR